MTDVASRIAANRGAIVRNQAFWGVIAIVLLLAINVIKDPGYLAIGYNDETGHLSGNLIDILRASAPILMIAVGMCLVVATSGIDLSVGSIMVVAGAVSMELLRGMDGTAGNAALTLAIALGIATALGAVNGILVSVVGLQPFISTLVMMLAGRGIAKVITGGQNTTADNDSFAWLANGYVVGIPVVFLLSMAIVALVWVLVRRSALGLMLEAIGMDSRASRLAGVKRRSLQLTVYSASGLLAGVAGVFATASVMTVDVSRTGYQLELDAILAVVIGGTSLAGGKFSIGGAVIGGLLIATLDKTVVFLGVPASATPAFKAIVIVVLCLLQSERVRNLFRNRRALRAQSQKEVVPA
ncbi:ABC transporter permease [Jiangella ureilytica]|uniref:ABC transporter permease n=1 Tax=Jiangella ureilytica TaxID=2530374 RepID=A0A4R4RHW5_9ACTN|nr:ABC transporter permease [Jiangella ureilytica]TDC48876.1 ABC transporter permease [Jiangella ureilytica]